MAAATITSKQLTVPREIRRALGVGPGDRLAFRIRDDGVVTVEPEKLDLLAMRGTIKPKMKGVTTQDMNEAIRRSASRP